MWREISFIENHFFCYKISLIKNKKSKSVYMIMIFNIFCIYLYGPHVLILYFILKVSMIIIIGISIRYFQMWVITLKSDEILYKQFYNITWSMNQNADSLIIKATRLLTIRLYIYLCTTINRHHLDKISKLFIH